MEKQVCAEGVGHDDGFRMPEFMMQILGDSLHLIREAEPLEFANGFSSGNDVASLPWFDYYAKDLQPLPGSDTLAGVKSVATVFGEKTGAELVGSADVTTGKPVILGPTTPGPRRIRSSTSW